MDIFLEQVAQLIISGFAPVTRLYFFGDYPQVAAVGPAVALRMQAAVQLPPELVGNHRFNFQDRS